MNMGVNASPFSTTTGIPVARQQFSSAGVSGSAPGQAAINFMAQTMSSPGRSIPSGFGVKSPQDLSLQKPPHLGPGGALVSVFVLGASNLTQKKNGDTLECKIRLLHPAHKPTVVGNFEGTWDAVKRAVLFEASPLEFGIQGHEIERAQIETTLWEPAREEEKGRGFLGEVIVNANRLHAMAKEQVGCQVSQNFDFSCKVSLCCCGVQIEKQTDRQIARQTDRPTDR